MSQLSIGGREGGGGRGRRPGAILLLCCCQAYFIFSPWLRGVRAVAMPPHASRPPFRWPQTRSGGLFPGSYRLGLGAQPRPVPYAQPRPPALLVGPACFLSIGPFITYRAAFAAGVVIDSPIGRCSRPLTPMSLLLGGVFSPAAFRSPIDRLSITSVSGMWGQSTAALPSDAAAADFSPFGRLRVPEGLAFASDGPGGPIRRFAFTLHALN